MRAPRLAALAGAVIQRTEINELSINYIYYTIMAVYTAGVEICSRLEPNKAVGPTKERFVTPYCYDKQCRQANACSYFFKYRPPTNNGRQYFIPTDP